MMAKLDRITSMAKDDLLALLYDWHNEHRLQNQRSDVEYFGRMLTKYHAHNILVVGAGTGRIANPLAAVANRVVALDINSARLARLQALGLRGLDARVGDIRDFATSERFDFVIVPYSTIQLIRPGTEMRAALKHIHDVMEPSAKLLIDVTTHFNSRQSHPWRQILEAYCPELSVVVSEYQSILRYADRVLLRYRYCVGPRILVEDKEVWYFHNHEELVRSVESEGMYVVQRDQGYGSSSSQHRYVYHVQQLQNLMRLS